MLIVKEYHKLTIFIVHDFGVFEYSTPKLTLCILMDFPIHMDTISKVSYIWITISKVSYILIQ